MERQEFKKTLEKRLKQYLPGEYITIIAERTQYSYEYTRRWFKSFMVHNGIEQCAINLLTEEKAKEQDKIKLIQS